MSTHNSISTQMNELLRQLASAQTLERDLQSSVSSAALDVTRLRENDFRLGGEALTLKKRKLEVLERRRALEEDARKQVKETECLTRDTRLIIAETAELKNELSVSQSNYSDELISLSKCLRSLLRSAASRLTLASMRSAALSGACSDAAAERARARKLDKEKEALDTARTREELEEQMMSQRILSLEKKFKEALAKRKEVREKLSQSQLLLQTSRDEEEDEKLGGGRRW